MNFPEKKKIIYNIINKVIPKTTPNIINKVIPRTAPKQTDIDTQNLDISGKLKLPISQGTCAFQTIF